VLDILTLNAFLLDIRLFGLVPVYRAAPHIAERLAALPAAVRETGADVVVLQEVYRRPHREFLAAALAGPYPHAAGLRHPGLPLGSGLLVLSRHPIERATPREFGAAFPEERLVVRMGSLDCRIVLPDGRRLRLIGLHLAAGGLREHPESPRAEAVRARQIAELLALAADEPADGGGPTILAGDFNCGPHSSPANWRQVADGGFADAFALAGAGEGYTWDTAENPLIRGTANRALPRQRIDHVFVRQTDLGAWPVAAAEVALSEPRIALPGGGPIPVSDHYGLRVRLGGL
jgi:endonuclease/exonuclease/phosphatase family metal-dependent hydrolase